MSALLRPEQIARDELAVEWLLSVDEPGLCLRTRRELLGEDVPDAAFAAAADGPKARRLLHGLGADGAPGDGWGGNATWRLLALLDLAVPADHPRMAAAADWVVEQALRRPQHHGRPTVVDGLHRFCANVEGNALIVGLGCGLSPADDRIQRLARALIEWQWPDGGWNCHRNARRRSTFHESLSAAKGLLAYHRSCGDPAALAAVQRTAELFLSHRLLFSLGTGTPSRASLTRRRPGRSSTSVGESWATRRTGITTSSLRSCFSPTCGRRPTRAWTTPWACSAGVNMRTDGGRPIGNGGTSTVVSPISGRSWTGAPPVNRAR